MRFFFCLTSYFQVYTSKMILRIFLFLVINFTALAVGGIYTTDGVKSDWYFQLAKAPWTPPGWVFGLAWTVIMICFSFYMAYLWNKPDQRKMVFMLYLIQWILNVSWNPVFFKYHGTMEALVIIVLLTMLIGFMLFRFLKILGVISLLIVPYLIWLIIATSLNGYIYMNN